METTKKYNHPALEGFCKRYELSDLIPAVEVIGCADWYEGMAVQPLENLVVFLASHGIVSGGKIAQVMGISFSEFYATYGDKIGKTIGKEFSDEKELRKLQDETIKLAKGLIVS